MILFLAVYGAIFASMFIVDLLVESNRHKEEMTRIGVKYGQGRN